MSGKRSTIEHQMIAYDGSNIVIKEAPISPGARILFGSFGLILLPLGLKGSYDAVLLILGKYDGPANIGIGALITITALVLGFVFLWAALNSGRTLVLNPKTKTAYLTKRYLSKAFKKQFAFSALAPSTVYLDPECSWDRDWRVRLKLPDRTSLSFFEWDESELSQQKRRSHVWSERINLMIGPNNSIDL